MSFRFARRASSVLAASAMALAGAAANAAPYFWADWQGADLDTGPGFQANGTITTGTSTVGVTYTNANGISFYQNGAAGQFDWYVNSTAGLSPYVSTQVDNRPTGTDIVALNRAGSQMLQFSQAIANPVFAFVSLNGNGYEFDQDFEILSLGGEAGHGCGYWGCGGASKAVVDIGGGVLRYQLNSNNVGGTEPHGTLRFLGTFDTVTWVSRSNENWNGFTVGVAGTAAEVCPPGAPNPAPGCPGNPPPTGVPEPGTWALVGLSLAGLGAARRRRG